MDIMKSLKNIKNAQVAGDIHTIYVGAMNACSLSEYESLMKEVEEMIKEFHKRTIGFYRR